MSGIPYRGYYLRLAGGSSANIILIVCEKTGRQLAQCHSLDECKGVIDAWCHQQRYGPIPEPADTT